MLVKAGVRGVDLSYLLPPMKAALKIISNIWGEEDLIITHISTDTIPQQSRRFIHPTIAIRPSVFHFNNNSVYSVLTPIGYKITIKPKSVWLEYVSKE